jgi:hypothetical protein
MKQDLQTARRNLKSPNIKTRKKSTQDNQNSTSVIKKAVLILK